MWSNCLPSISVRHSAIIASWLDKFQVTRIVALHRSIFWDRTALGSLPHALPLYLYLSPLPLSLNLIYSRPHVLLHSHAYPLARMPSPNHLLPRFLASRTSRQSPLHRSPPHDVRKILSRPLPSTSVDLLPKVDCMISIIGYLSKGSQPWVLNWLFTQSFFTKILLHACMQMQGLLRWLTGSHVLK
jgi:hypothetical protein